MNGSHCHAPSVTVLKEEIDSQLALEMIDECEDTLPEQKVVTVKKPNAVSSHVCIDTRAINKGLIVKPFALPPPLGRPRVRGKRKKKFSNEKLRASDSNDLVIRDHLRELRVIKDPGEQFGVSNAAPFGVLKISRA